MNIPRYWAKSTPRPTENGEVAVWGWSDTSPDDAKRCADARATSLAQRPAAESRNATYGYPDQPLREEIADTLTNDAGEPIALVTRNAYGALVLNTARAMFIDVDFPEDAVAIPGAGFFRKLLGRAGPAGGGPEASALARLREWAAAHAELGLRIYRTAAGLRAVVTSATFDPAQQHTIDLLTGAGSDPLYIRLCRSQACFRARLTPKPWRCGLGAPPARFPLLDAACETAFRRWEAAYERAMQPYAVCRLVEHLGPGDVHPEVQPILALHDQFTCAAADTPLA